MIMMMTKGERLEVSGSNDNDYDYDNDYDNDNGEDENNLAKDLGYSANIYCQTYKRQKMMVADIKSNEKMMVARAL